MQKTKIEINIANFPKELHNIFNGAQVYDSSCNPNARVLYSDKGYYIKIAEKGTLAKEAAMTDIFAGKEMGVEVVAYFSKEKDYMVTKSAEGEDALHYLENPKRLCEVLAGAMKSLHSRPITGVPVSPCMELYDSLGKGTIVKKDTFIHGDFCLPNIMLKDWKFSSFIDVGLAGVGDKHIDIYWVLWSLSYNLKTDKYTGYFLDLYGRDNYDRDILRIVAEVEAQT